VKPSKDIALHRSNRRVLLDALGTQDVTYRDRTKPLLAILIADPAVSVTLRTESSDNH
jgi:hypothetical protein